MKPLLKLSLAMILLAAGTSRILAQPVVILPPHIVIADGAGAYSTLTNHLKDINYEMPKCRRAVLHPVEWANGDNLLDYRCLSLHLAGAARIVREVQQIRKCAPASPIVLIGYSAGACPVLFAAEQLPPDSIDRIILLGPTMPARYDIRLALKAPRMGIDSFYVCGDDFMVNQEQNFGAPYEGYGAKLAGTTGFLIADPRRSPVRDPILCKLRQHEMMYVINNHFDMARPCFLYRFILPIIP